MKTVAALLVTPGKPIVIDEIEIPALKRGQVLVEIAYSGACHTQVLEARGYRGEDKWVPHCLGHEGTGTVLECDASVAKVAKGDKVVLSWLKGLGAEAGGAVYQWQGRAVNAGGVTTFQRHAVVSENRLTKLAGDLSLDLGVAMGCAVPTGMGSVLNVGRVQAGDTVAIFGCGGIGLNATAAAAHAGASMIVGIDPQRSKRETAKLFGATHVVDPDAGDVLAELRKIAPAGLDVAIEATGLSKVMDQALRCVRQQGGRAVVIGNARAGSTLTLDPGLFNQGKSLLGTWGGDTVPDRDFPRFGRLLMSPRFDMRQLLSKPYRLVDINTALDDLEAGRVNRPLIDMSLD
jgi:S-(hydroxymethyl)glutathione dehydrogenase / alcohol dehydrogenase